MKAQKQWIFIAFLVVASIAVTAYFGTSQSEVASLTVTTYPQPAKIGYVTIQIDSTVALKTAHVILPERNAEFNYSKGNSYYYSYFVSPYDEIGLKPMIITAFDENGHEIIDTNQSLYVGYNAAGAKFNDVIFYSFDSDPTMKALEHLITGDLNVIFESKQRIQNDIEFLQTFSDMVLELAARGDQITIFDAGTENGKWISCIDSNSTKVDVSVCLGAMEERPSVILRYPDYPTTQVFITNNTIEIQPKLGESGRTVDAIVELLNYIPPIELITGINSTVTPNNSTQ